jgi:hypothetical protein
MTPRTSSPRQGPAASRAIDAIIEASGDWRSTMLARLRAVILSADASIVEEVKWKKPSRAVDFREGDMVNEAALRALIGQAAELNTSRARTRRGRSSGAER